MGYAFIASVAAGAGANPDVTNTTEANMLGANTFFILVASFPASGTPVPSDSETNTYELIGQQTGDTLISVFMAKNATASATQTFHATLTDGFMGVVALGFSGGHPSDPVDAEWSNTNGVASSFNFGLTVNPSEANTLAIVSIAIENAFTVQGTTGFAGTQTPYVLNENYGCAGMYKIMTIPEALDPTTFFTGTVNFSARIDLFLSAEGGDIILMGDGLT